jgi:hypothetical protein
MAVNVSEYINKFQEQGLAALKESQEASLEAMSSFREFSKEMSEKPGSMPTFENVPTPTQFIELSFGFARQMLEMRKAFTMRVAEMLVESQKQGEAEFRSATTASSARAHAGRRTNARRK